MLIIIFFVNHTASRKVCLLTYILLNTNLSLWGFVNLLLIYSIWVAVYFKYSKILKFVIILLMSLESLWFLEGKKIILPRLSGFIAITERQTIILWEYNKQIIFLLVFFNTWRTNLREQWSSSYYIKAFKSFLSLKALKKYISIMVKIKIYCRSSLWESGYL